MSLILSFLYIKRRPTKATQRSPDMGSNMKHTSNAIFLYSTGIPPSHPEPRELEIGEVGRPIDSRGRLAVQQARQLHAQESVSTRSFLFHQV